MKKLLKILIFASFAVSSLNTTVQANLTAQKLDSSLVQNSGIIKLVEKVIFAKVQKQQILSTSELKYSHEFAYFFNKIGFKSSPVSFLIFENGSVINLNPDWKTNQFNSNQGKGVLFALFVYNDSFDLQNFNNALSTFKNDVLRKEIGKTALESTDDFELSQFLIEANSNQPSVTFQSPEKNAVFKTLFADLDFKKKQNPDLTITKISYDATADPQTVNTGKVIIKNNSNFPAVFSERNKLELKFSKDSAFFTNNKWLNLKTPLSIKEGSINSNEEKVFDIYFTTPLLPGKITESMKSEFKDKALNEQTVVIATKDTGQKVLKIRGSEIGYIIVRKEASSNSAEVGRVATSQLYRYYEIKNNFYRIIINGEIAWVTASVVEVVKK